MYLKLNQHLLILLLLLITAQLYYHKQKDTITFYANSSCNILNYGNSFESVVVNKPVRVSAYFTYMDSLVKQHNTLSSYTFTEHHLVRANPWIIENLQNTDYYRMMARDSFVYNQKDLVVLEKGCMIQIPSAQKTLELENAFKRTTLDINIPEFKLRIIEDSNVLYSIPIRVGKNEKRFLKMSGKIEDLRTKTGEGVIINYIRNPRYVNPVNNHEYFVTRRDDNKLTKLPQIPFIETEINGFRYGQLIHPTTNPATLGKASSNGCIGTSEADAWLIYYYAPIGTNINIRYDLTRINTSGDTIVFKDIYTINKSQMD